jgi:hypothetical protein
MHWTPAPVSDFASAFGLVRPYGCRGFRMFSTRVVYPMSSNKLWDYDCLVFRRLSATTRVSVFSLTYTDLRVFANSHGFLCHTDSRVFVSLASSRRHTEFRVFRKHMESRSTRNFVFSATHSSPYHTEFRITRSSVSSCFRLPTKFQLHVCRMVFRMTLYMLLRSLLA